MKWWIFKINLVTFLLIFSFSSFVSAEDGKYEKRIARYQLKWNKLIPRYTKLQYAGSMGFLSVGTGWEYGKSRHWETDIMVGIIPKNSVNDARPTFTLKQNYIPWHLALDNKHFVLEPLACGLYFNTIFGEEYWAKMPARYPNKYYTFSTKLRTNVYMGERITYKIPSKKRHLFSSVAFYYEISSNELYIISAIGNTYLKPKDYLHLSFGLKANFF